MEKRWQMYKNTGLIAFIVLVLVLYAVVTFSSGKAEHIVPETVMVKAGSFQMGDEVGDLWDGCRPVHAVTLTYDSVPLMKGFSAWAFAWRERYYNSHKHRKNLFAFSNWKKFKDNFPKYFRFISLKGILF